MEHDSSSSPVRSARVDHPAPLTAVGLCVGLMLSATPAHAALGSIFSCTVNGKTFTADRVPSECANADVREMNRDGSVRRVIARPLTLDEQRARAMEAKRRLEEEEKQLTQRRRDKSLLEAYATDEEIEAVRGKALESSNVLIARASQRLANLQGERKKLDNESEFYKKRVVPEEIKRGYVSLTQQVAAEEKIIQDAQFEIQRINERFDAEKKRFRELLAHGARPVQRNPETDILLDPRFRGK